MDNRSFDILLVSSNEDEKKVISNICKDFSYLLKDAPSFEEVLENPIDAKIIIISDSSLPSGVNIAEAAQGMKQVAPQAFQISLIAEDLSKDKSVFLHKSGTDMIALRSELLETSKFWFAITQILKATYLPIKSIDIPNGVVMPITIYHLLPQRNKFIPFVFSGDMVSPEKFEKMKTQHEFYFHRSEATLYHKFIQDTCDMSAAGLAKRCRAAFLALQSEFTELVLEISDQSNHASFGEGQELVQRCHQLCEDLLKTLGEFPKAWEIINSSSIGDFGSLERSPSISAYCGLFALLMELPEVSNLMLTAMLCDLAVIRLPAEVTKEMREKRIMDSELESKMHAVPELSLKMILSRKLSFDERSRNIIISTYERADGKGFPKKIDYLKLSMGAQLIRFARDFDRATLLRLGEERKNPIKILHELTEKLEPGEIYTDKFINSIKENVVSSEIFNEPRANSA